MKRTLFLLVVILLIGVGWWFGWHYVASEIDARIDSTNTRLAERGREVICSERTISGFPFRVSVECAETGFTDANSRFGFSAGSMKSAAQVYQPGKIVGELNGPAEVRLPDGRSLDVAWQSMRSSLSVDTQGLEKISLIGTEVDIKPRDSLTDFVDADKLQFHGRRVKSQDVELAIRSEDISSPQSRWPSFNLSATGRFEGIYHDLLAQPDILRIARQNGLQGNVLRFDYALVSGGSVSFTGPFEIDRSGILSGKFNLVSRDLAKLAQVLRRVFPEHQQMLDQAMPVIELLGGRDGKNEVKVTVTVSRGNASLGLIPVGRIPPLF